jgi:asparagine synthase (glutamine-hydrolysing)
MTQCRGAPIDTFNLGFTGDAVGSEHVEAAAVARHIGARHHPLMISPDEVLGSFERMLQVYDEPFADQAALPTLLLASHARRDVTVVLTGEGADEVFAGYGNYRKRIREERYTRWLGAPGSPLPAMIRWLPAVLRKDRVLKAAMRPLAERYVTIPNVFDEQLRDTVYAPEFRAQVSERLAAYAARFFDQCNSADYLDHLLHVDASLWLPDDLLTKVDRATMASSLEARVPYLDHCFVQTCARLAARQKLDGRTTKSVLKKVAMRYLPAAIVDRNKQGFMMPLDQWLAGRLAPLLDDALGAGGLGRRNLVQQSAIDRLRADHSAGRRNHAMRLWTLLVLEHWFRRHLPDFRL